MFALKTGVFALEMAGLLCFKEGVFALEKGVFALELAGLLYSKEGVFAIEQGLFALEEVCCWEARIEGHLCVGAWSFFCHRGL